mgnify:CR=1 FL=1
MISKEQIAHDLAILAVQLEQQQIYSNYNEKEEFDKRKLTSLKNIYSHYYDDFLEILKLPKDK